MVKRGRAKDEYPEWIREQMTLTLLDPSADAVAVSAVQIADWTLPVELDLVHPTFIELNSLTCWIDAAKTLVAGTATAVAGELSLDRSVRIYILNERRTAEPTLSDNAIIAKFVLNLRMSWVATTAAATNTAFFDVFKSKLRDHREYEDARTGMGLLITQPRLYLLVVEQDMQGSDNHEHQDQTTVGFKMTFRLTDRVTSREFWTEQIAKFS